MKTAMVVVLVLAAFGTASADPIQVQVVKANFSPHGGCTADIVGLIGTAKRSVLLAGYSFTSTPIADALVARRKAGVRVELVLDRSDAGEHPVRGSKAEAVKAGGAAVWIDSKHAIFHDKYLIVDGAYLETGSFNYTTAAERSNAENCLILRSVELASQYTADWTSHQAHARRL